MKYLVTFVLQFAKAIEPWLIFKVSMEVISGEHSIELTIKIKRICSELKPTSSFELDICNARRTTWQLMKIPTKVYKL